MVPLATVVGHLLHPAALQGIRQAHIVIGLVLRRPRRPGRGRSSRDEGDAAAALERGDVCGAAGPGAEDRVAGGELWSGQQDAGHGSCKKLGFKVAWSCSPPLSL